MSNTPHHIRRQRIELRAPDSGTAFALRAQMRRDVDEVLLPALSQAFDEAARAAGIGDAIVRIPHLALRLRVRNADELSQSFARDLPTLIAEQLDVALAALTVRGSVQGQSVPERRRTSLLHYLASGQLDWPEAQGDSAEQAIRLRDEAEQLVSHWRDSPATIQRLVPVQYERILFFFFRLLQLLPSAQRASCVEVLANARVTHRDVSREKIAQRLRELALTLGLADYSVIALQARALSVLWADSLPPLARLQREISNQIPEHNIAEVLAHIFDEALHSTPSNLALPLQRASTQKSNAPQKDLAGKVSSPEPMLDRDATPADIAAQAAAAPVPRASPPQADENEGVAQRVYAAGLVLAHPFLRNLFSARAVLATDEKSILPSKLPQAAALLHYLATGREEVYEFELGLIKTFLGLRATDHLPIAQGLLNAADREECSALLSAMISHWPALRTTSVAGLRVSFLQRHGLLRPIDNGPQSGWQLQLESESFDILLAQLPWSISIVRLPWMTKPIFTEWQTR